LPGNAYDCTDNIEMKTSLWMLIVDRTGHSPEKVITHGASRTAPAMQDLRGMNFTAPER
jgi:hypothetical protein